MKWTKIADDRWICRVPPDDRFTLKAARKADGRWAWQVYSGAADNPMASGLVNTIGDAKHVMEQFLKRAGFT